MYWTLCFIVDFPPDTLLQSKLSPDTLHRSKMSPCKGDNLLRRGSLSFEVKCPGRTVCFEVKCPGDSLLRSNLPPGHFIRGSSYFVTSLLPHGYLGVAPPLDPTPRSHPFLLKITISANNYRGIPPRHREAVIIAVGHDGDRYAQLK